MKGVLLMTVLSMACVASAQMQEGSRVGPLRAPRGPRPTMMDRGMMGGGMGGIHGDRAIAAIMNPKVAEKIGLSEDIRTQIRKIDADSRKAAGDIRQKMRAARMKQSTLLSANKPDEAAIMAAIDEYFEIQKSLVKGQAKSVIAIKALLTPEQLDKAIAEMKALRESRRNAERPEPPKEAKDAPKEPVKEPAKEASAK